MTTLRTVFAERFGTLEPTHAVMAPGRVNLIGEHIDYNGLPVFPMAIDRRIAMLIRVRPDNRVRMYNVAKQYESLDFTISSLLEPYPEGEWGNYVKAAVQELMVRYLELEGFDAAIFSDIPVAAGLSSSSALVVATALALLRASEISVDSGELAEMLAKAERYVGTEGGGMDQTICLSASEGTATRIDFDPIRLSATPVPSNWRFVVANSLVRAEKSGAAREAYNRRPRECREALLSVVKKLGLVGEVESYPDLLAETPVDDVVTAARSALPDVLNRRFMHVITEAVRVMQAETAMRNCDIDTFGRLISESHESLRDDFSVSCPELDELTEIATGAGAAGARLTGAGFGGCVLALCTSETVGRVLSVLQEKYYSARGHTGKLKNVLFVARPSEGAAVREL